MSPLCRRDRSGNVFLRSKCRSLETVAIKPLFYLFSTTCVGRGSKAVAVAISNDLAPRATLSLRWGPCTEMPAGVGTQQQNGRGQGAAQHERVHAALFPSIDPLQDQHAAPSKGNVWFPNPVLAGMQIPSFHVCVGWGGWLYNFNDCRKIFICQ